MCCGQLRACSCKIALVLINGKQNLSHPTSMASIKILFKKKKIYICSQIQAAGFAALSMLGILAHNCQIEMIDSRLIHFMYAIYFRGTYTYVQSKKKALVSFYSNQIRSLYSLCVCVFVI